MKTIDTKSALIGLALGVLVTLAVAATSGPATGRFFISSAGNTGLVIDTTTGQVWRNYFPLNNGVTDSEFFKPKFGDNK